jgi:diphthamide biosynthesis protein 7
LDGSGALRRISSYKAHKFEAWTAGFDYWNPNIVYSGGDDAMFCRFDVRQLNNGPTATDRRTHEMGVSAIQSHPLTEHLLLTGSYDESLRLWDVRSIKQPVHSFSTGGGVWRIKPHPQNPSLVLLANMYSGFKAVTADPASGIEETKWVLNHGEGPTPLSYACDWQCNLPNGPQRNCNLFSTCTFYTKTLCLYKCNSPKKL